MRRIIYSTSYVADWLNFTWRLSVSVCLCLLCYSDDVRWWCRECAAANRTNTNKHTQTHTFVDRDTYSETVLRTNQHICVCIVCLCSSTGELLELRILSMCEQIDWYSGDIRNKNSQWNAPSNIVNSIMSVCNANAIVLGMEYTSVTVRMWNTYVVFVCMWVLSLRKRYAGWRKLNATHIGARGGWVRREHDAVTRISYTR